MIINLPLFITYIEFCNHGNTNCKVKLTDWLMCEHNAEQKINQTCIILLCYLTYWRYRNNRLLNSIFNFDTLILMLTELENCHT